MFLLFVSYLVYLPLSLQWDCPTHPDEDLTITQFITKYGYPVETHIILTEDGYILQTQRIPHGRGSNKPNDKVVLLVHGLGGSAENYITLGEEGALAFLLADRGFDVWLFNARGTLHSRDHLYLSPIFQASRFWDFSWHEIGIYDLPANIDYILEVTNKSKLFYVGHSQGCTSYFVLMAEKPEYNNKIELGVMLAPPILMDFSEIIFVKIAKFNSEIEKQINIFNYHEFPIPNSPMLNPIFKTFCLLSEHYMQVCVDIIYLIGGLESGLLERSLIPVIFTYTPAGFSARQFLHYMQEMRSGLFRQYDYGVDLNLLKYNQEEPPLYDLNNAVAPVALFFGPGDYLASIRQKDYLLKMIPNIFRIYDVQNDKFNHVDFVYAYNAKELVYDPVYEIIMNYIETNN